MTAVAARELEFSPTTPSIGADVTGIDLTRPLSASDRERVLDGLMRFHVLFFRDQDVDNQRLVELGRALGEPIISTLWRGMDGFPEVAAIHNDAKTEHVIGELWHSDMTCDEIPPMGSILAMKVLPPTGGDTLWASMNAAYDALSPRMQLHLDGLHASHNARLAMSWAADHAVRRDVESGQARVPTAIHPVVRTHPVTGKKSLYVNPFFTSHIVELPKQEGDAILHYLYDHCADPNFAVRFRWSVNAVVMWDNRCTQHMALHDYLPATRTGYRVQIQGTKPV